MALLRQVVGSGGSSVASLCTHSETSDWARSECKSRFGISLLHGVMDSVPRTICQSPTLYTVSASVTAISSLCDPM